MSESGVWEFVTERRVEFSDTDMEGIIHFSRYLIYLETAEHLFLNSLGSSVAATWEGEKIGWPRLSVGCEFVRPVRFEDELKIRLLVLRKGRRSMTYGTEFSHDGRLVARGQSSCACCVMEEGGGLRATDIPAPLAARIATAPAEEIERWEPPIRAL
ncbi:MAG: thioesterase family protein [Thermoanaerobaculia bacterium]|nr:thioesterase family protein [Thermoanaerobaculia bacterium]